MLKRLKIVSSSILVPAMLMMNYAASAEQLSGTKVESKNTDDSVEAISDHSQEESSQVTSVSQLSDVQPNDWAFQALQSLVERYGCIAGYPNGTFRGNRALSRYEFAAGLNACLDRINELIANATGDLPKKEDIATSNKLYEEFSAELATLRGRVDAVEARTAELEANQFSTTTKLQGQIVTAVSGILSGDRIDGASITDKNITLGARARLELVSSFTGKDTLFTRIQSNNLSSPGSSSTTEGNLFFQGSENAIIDALLYGFPVGKNTQVKLIANAGAADDVANTINLFDGDGAFGALSTFGARNPIYGQLGDKGIAINHEFSNKLGLSLGYLAGNTDDPAPGNGLFNGSYGALAQLTVKPSDRTTIGLTYINSYNLSLATGSNNATTDFNGEAFSSNSYGVQTSIGISDKFVIGGWVGYTNSQVLTGTKGDVDIWNYAITLGFPDLGKKGNLGGVILGVEPKVTNATGGLASDPNTSYHIEAFYQYKVSDNITITPGLIWLTAPNHNNNNDDIVIGALRTTFSF